MTKTIDTGCRLCGVPVLVGRIDRSLHPPCSKVYYMKYRKKWYKDNVEREREKRRNRARTFREENPEKRMLSGAKDRARVQNLPFDLDLTDILIPEYCPILDVKLEYNTEFAPSLDKIDPKKGYVKGNVQVISRKANTMKQDATQEELEKFAKWVLKTYQH